MSVLRSEVLKAFKNIHRTAQNVFANDIRIINAAKTKINLEYKKNKEETDKKVIEERIQLSRQVETELKANVIQAEETKPGIYQAKINKDTHKLENIMFNENAVLNASPKNRKCKK